MSISMTPKTSLAMEIDNPSEESQLLLPFIKSTFIAVEVWFLLYLELQFNKICSHIKVDSCFVDFSCTIVAEKLLMKAEMAQSNKR